MKISTGTKLSHYEITSQIGKGGMGEVYQAKDTKLWRNVAIKVLPEEFARDADRVARFQREAKLLASLNHPNIAAIHGLEEVDGTNFLVMELVEGETLADRISRGPIPVDEALKLALQIAEALEAAHEKGVIHRDLKPANIKVTPDGKVKVLDFGLAKAFAGEQADLNLSNSPTLSVAATQQGVVLGTAAYMSPEQARGKEVDTRSDIWAFGVVLFEMLNGKQVFTGDTVSDTLASVLAREPEWKSLPPSLHPRIGLLLERCLEKEPKNRCSGISDARVEIQKVLDDPSGVFVQSNVMTEPRKILRVGIPWVAATVIVAVIITGLAVWDLKPTEPRQVIRFYQELPEDQEFKNDADSVIDLSADGTKIVYAANNQLYLRNLNEFTARPIQGTVEGPVVPIISPDSQWVGYYSVRDRQWKKISIAGGTPVTLCDGGLSFGATWGPDDTILFGGEEAGIMRVPAKGGTAELLIKRKESEWFHGPQALPGGEWVLFTVRNGSSGDWDKAQIAAQSLKTGERRILVAEGSDGRYVPTGHLVYALGGVLYAKAFDVDSMEVTGGEVPIVEGVQRASVTGSANYGFSDTGMLAYVLGSVHVAPKQNLVWVGRNGNEEPLGADSGAYRNPRISPDGTKVALTVDNEGKSDVWIWDSLSENMQRLTFTGSSSNPLWTLDGKRIAFMSGNEGDVYWKAADGTGEDELIGSAPGVSTAPNAWSVDGKMLVTMEFIQGFNFNIGSLSMEGDHPHKPLLQEEYIEGQPQISPDGRWMAYMAIESDVLEVYVCPFPDVDKGRWQVSKNGGTSPLWSPDGKEFFYRKGNEVIAVSIQTEPTFKAGKSEILFRGNYASMGLTDFHPWDVDPIVKRFLMMKESADDSATEKESRPTITVVTNWFEELKEKVPVD